MINEQLNEIRAATVTAIIAKYHYFGGQRVAVKNSSGVSYMHGDHPSILRDKSRLHQRDQQRSRKQPNLLSLRRDIFFQQHIPNRLR